MQHDYHNHYDYPSFCIIIIIIMIIIVELPSTLVVCRVSFCIMFVKCNFCCANNFATRSVCESVYLSVCMFVCLSVFLSVCMYVLLSARLPDSLLICLTVFLSLRLSVLALKICWLCGQKCCGLCICSLMILSRIIPVATCHTYKWGYAHCTQNTAASESNL